MKYISTRKEVCDMFREKEGKRYVFGFVAAFLLLAVIRHISNSIESSHTNPCYFYMISQIGSVLITSCWMLTVQSRVIHTKIRRLMLASGALFLLYFSMQMVKYCLFAENSDVERYMWYGYYIPMTLIPLMALYILQHLSDSIKTSGGKRPLLLIPAALICLGFLTNDLHQLAFGIPNWYENGDKGRTLGPIYFVYIAFMAVLLILGSVRAIRLCKNIKNKRKVLYPAIPLLLGIVYLILYTVKKEWIMIGGQELFEIAEAFAFMMLGFLEGCIQIGLIPTNVGYGKLFSLTGIPARITQSDGKAVYNTKGAENGFEESDDHRIVKTAIIGGNFFYDVDLSVLNRLNKELVEETANLETRNELLCHENEITEEREKSKTAIHIYDSISEIVRPQVLKIQNLLSVDGDEEQLRRNLAHCSVLNAYIKRRSNMELEAQKNGTLPFKEVVTAVAESLEYVKLTGMETFLSSSGEGVCQAGQIIRGYSAFESVTETVIGKADYMTVRLEKDSSVRVRFLLSGKADMSELSALRFDGCHTEYTEEENDAELLISLSEGGDGQ